MKKTTEEKMKKEEEEEEEEEFDLDKMEVLFMNKPVEEKKRPAKKKEIPRLTSSFGITFNNTAGLPEGYRQHTSHSSNDTDKSFNSMMHKLLYGTDRIPTGGSCNVITAGNNVLKEFSDIKEFGLLHTVLHVSLFLSCRTKFKDPSSILLILYKEGAIYDQKHEF